MYEKLVAPPIFWPVLESSLELYQLHVIFELTSEPSVPVAVAWMAVPDFTESVASRVTFCTDTELEADSAAVTAFLALVS